MRLLAVFPLGYRWSGLVILAVAVHIYIIRQLNSVSHFRFHNCHLVLLFGFTSEVLFELVTSVVRKGRDIALF